MKTKTNILILFLFLTLATGVSAATFQEIPTDLISSRPQTKWEQCHFNIFCYFRENLGASFTTINSTDKIKDLPTTLNANFALINTGFLDMGTTSVDSITTLSNLATIGTITTGVWNGTTIAVANGGTGSTTLSEFSILLGSSTNAIGQVTGLGTSGQFLTSNGDGTAPSWQSASVNQTLEYDWTGLHDFTATTTFNNATGAASAFFGKLFFAGLGTTTLDFSGTNANSASSTFMGTDSTGAVSHIPYSYLLQTSTSTDPVTVSNASTTLFSVDIPANALRDFSVIKGTAAAAWLFASDGGVTDDALELVLYYGSSPIAYSSTTPDSWTTNNTVTCGATPVACKGGLDFQMIVTGTTQEGSFVFNGIREAFTSATIRAVQLTFSSLDYTASESMTTQKTFSLEAKVANSSNSFTLRNFHIELIR